MKPNHARFILCIRQQDQTIKTPSFAQFGVLLCGRSFFTLEHSILQAETGLNENKLKNIFTKLDSIQTSGQQPVCCSTTLSCDFSKSVFLFRNSRNSSSLQILNCSRMKISLRKHFCSYRKWKKVVSHWST